MGIGSRLLSKGALFPQGSKGDESIYLLVSLDFFSRLCDDFDNESLTLGFGDMLSSSRSFSGFSLAGQSFAGQTLRKLAIASVLCAGLGGCAWRVQPMPTYYVDEPYYASPYYAAPLYTYGYTGYARPYYVGPVYSYRLDRSPHSFPRGHQPSYNGHGHPGSGYGHPGGGPRHR